MRKASRYSIATHMALPPTNFIAVQLASPRERIMTTVQLSGTEREEVTKCLKGRSEQPERTTVSIQIK
jgi:hypothetical protein